MMRKVCKRIMRLGENTVAHWTRTVRIATSTWKQVNLLHLEERFGKSIWRAKEWTCCDTKNAVIKKPEESLHLEKHDVV